LRWTCTKSGLFEVKSYKTLWYDGDTVFPWKSIWRVKVPLKVALFAWTAALGKILTIDNLCRRMVVVIDWCFMCKKAGETVDHLLIHCDYARELWSLVFSLFGVSWVIPHIVLELLACWWRRASARSHNAIWNATPLCLMWLLGGSETAGLLRI
jgi:hypothetical protein